MHDDDILTIALTRAQARALRQAVFSLQDLDGYAHPNVRDLLLRQRRARAEGVRKLSAAILTDGVSPGTDREVFRLTFDRTGHFGG
jgi:hypothetical protein